MLIKCLWDPKSAQGLAYSRHLQSPLDNSLAVVPSPFWNLKTTDTRGLRCWDQEVKALCPMMRAEPGGEACWNCGA